MKIYNTRLSGAIFLEGIAKVTGYTEVDHQYFVKFEGEQDQLPFERFAQANEIVS